MQVKSLRNLLNKVDKILSYYPDKTVNYVLSDINSILEKKSKSETMVKVEKKEQLNIESEEEIESISSRIDTISIDEIKVLLENKKTFPNIYTIRHFASLLGINISKNQSRADSVHTLIKAVERSQIDKTISERKK